jgi:hypothetical protein
MNLEEYLSKHRDDDPPSVDRIMSFAPWLNRTQAAYWARVIADDVREGRYTAARQWSIASAIVAEKGEDA